MSIDYQWLEVCRQNVTEAERGYNDAVSSELPIGTVVEYQHGEHWIGPYEVTGYGGVMNAGYVLVRNLKTEKVREVWVHKVRITEEVGTQ